jgi:hypothetical protein
MVSCSLHFISNIVARLPFNPLKPRGNCMCETGSSVSIVCGYGLDDRAIKVRYPAEAKGFFL